MRINCIHCGHKFDLGDAYDDYEGMVRCDTCRGGLLVRTQEGSVRSVMPWAIASTPANAPAPPSLPAAAPSTGGPATAEDRDAVAGRLESTAPNGGKRAA